MAFKLGRRKHIDEKEERTFNWLPVWLAVAQSVAQNKLLLPPVRLLSRTLKPGEEGKEKVFGEKKFHFFQTQKWRTTIRSDKLASCLSTCSLRASIRLTQFSKILPKATHLSLQRPARYKKSYVNSQTHSKAKKRAKIKWQSEIEGFLLLPISRISSPFVCVPSLEVYYASPVAGKPREWEGAKEKEKLGESHPAIVSSWATLIQNLTELNWSRNKLNLRNNLRSKMRNGSQLRN